MAKNASLASWSFPIVLWADMNRSVLGGWMPLFSSSFSFGFIFFFFCFLFVLHDFFFFFWYISNSQDLERRQVGPFSFPGKPWASPTSVTLKDRGAKSSSKLSHLPWPLGRMFTWVGRVVIFWGGSYLALLVQMFPWLSLCVKNTSFLPLCFANVSNPKHLPLKRLENSLLHFQPGTAKKPWEGSITVLTFYLIILILSFLLLTVGIGLLIVIWPPFVHGCGVLR